MIKTDTHIPHLDNSINVLCLDKHNDKSNTTAWCYLDSISTLYFYFQDFFSITPGFNNSIPCRQFNGITIQIKIFNII